mgnify:CR=1 FL=1
MHRNVFVISMPDAIARRTPQIEDLQTKHIDHEIWPAVDGRNGLDASHEMQIDRAATLKTLGRHMTDAEYGCALSHQEIYREVLARNLDHAVILEDDAILAPGFADLITGCRLDDYDILLLYHARARVHRGSRRDAGGQNTAYRAATMPLGAVGYVVSKGGAEKLIAQNSPIIAPTDWPSDISLMKTYACHPRLITHPDLEHGPSELRAERQQKQASQPKRTKETAARFLTARYWKRTYYKRLGKWIS